MSQFIWFRSIQVDLKIDGQKSERSLTLAGLNFNSIFWAYFFLDRPFSMNTSFIFEIHDWPSTLAISDQVNSHSFVIMNAM